MRLLFVSNVFPNPFQPNKGPFNAALVRALARRHEVRVVSPVSWTDEWRAKGQGALGPDRCRSVDGVQVYHPRYFYTPKVFRGQYGFFMWRSIGRTLRQVAAGFRPEAVVAYWAHPDGEVAVRTARIAGVPAVVMVGGSDVLLLAKNRIRRRRIVNVLRSADAVVTTSMDLKAKVGAHVDPERVHVCYRGVDSSQFAPGSRADARRRLGLPLERPALLWVGRMVPVKGLDILLEACAILKDRAVECHLYLVGDGDLRERLAAMAKRLGLGKRVTFAGPVAHDRLRDWYQAADLTVLSSRSEGVPNVLRESIACGTPFVATCVGGVEELREQADCELVPPEDPTALANGIARKLSGMAAGGAVAAPAGPVGDWDQSAEALVSVIRPLLPGPHTAGEEGAGRLGAAAPSGVRQAVRRAMAAVLPRKWFLVKGPKSSQEVCLTFDDGPHPEHTPRLLDVLRSQHVTASFFVIGKHAEKYPDLVRRMAAEGHTVGHHSYHHSDPGQVSPAGLVSEVRQTAEILRGVLGVRPTLFRPPHGKVTAQKLLRLWTSGQQIVLWNSDPKDFVRRSAGEISNWFRRHPVQGGDVVLLHDNAPHTAEALPQVILDARGRGLEFAAVGRWMGA